MNQPIYATPNAAPMPVTREAARERMELTMAAITGMCAAQQERGSFNVDPVLIARRAVRIADATLAELRSPQGGARERTA